MQNTKDTFYEVIRGRLAAMNPLRSIAVRGVMRPGSLVDENEIVNKPIAPDCFHLRWTHMEVGSDGPLPLVCLTCEVRYETAGTALAGGLDRGRSLGQMDAELLAAVIGAPMRATKTSYAAEANGGVAESLNSAIWWGAAQFGALENRGERLFRVATVKVMSYQEPQE